MFTTELTLGLAFGLDRLGEPPARLHPVVWLGRYLIWVKGRRERLETPRALFWAGTAFLLLGCLVVGVVAGFAGWSLRLLPLWLRLPLSAALLKPSFSLVALVRAGDEVRHALEGSDLPEARRRLAYHLVSRDTSGLSEAEVAGAAVESLAENLSDSVVAPLFYFALFGLAGAWVYRFVNTADAVLGYRTGKLEHLGKASARLDDALNVVPARLSALLLCVSAPTIDADPGNAWRVMWRDAGETPSPNAGWTMAAAAGGLNVRLDKRGAYTLNSGGRAPAAEDIRLTARWVSASSLLAALLLGASRPLWDAYA